MIEMIAGVFGMPIKDKSGKTIRIKGMGPGDGPFSVSPEREAELVAKKIARYVDDVAADPDEDYVSNDAPIGFDETPPADFVGDDAEDEAEIVEEIVDLKSLSAKELREMGKEYGLTFKANTKREEMIEKIAAAQFELADGEDAPSFDASEAVE